MQPSSQASRGRPRADVVFDLDGTLTDPAEGFVRSVNHALVEHGFGALPPADLVGHIGPPLDDTFRSVLGDAAAPLLTSLVLSYRERYAQIGYAENVMYVGIVDALTTLHQRGATLGVCTSKRVDFAERILTMFQIRRRFAFVDGGDVGVTKADQLRRLLESHRVTTSSTMVGDRAVDVMAAKSIGMRSVAVLYGYGSYAELAATDPDLLVTTPADLATIIW